MIKQILSLFLLLGLLVIPVVSLAAVCGDGTYLGCVECATQELCEAEVPCLFQNCSAYGTQELCEAAEPLPCSWNIDVCEGDYCYNQGMAVVESADITEIGSKAGGLSADLMALIALVVGVPLSFMMIKRAMGIMPKK